MKGWWSGIVALALLMLTPIAPPPLAAIAQAAGKPAAVSAPKAKVSLRQFSGVVTALDKESITVEKGGRKPKTMVFTKDAEMRTTGDLEKEARVTVYYRDDGGRSVAHRVVVRGEGSGSAGGR